MKPTLLFRGARLLTLLFGLLALTACTAQVTGEPGLDPPATATAPRALPTPLPSATVQPTATAPPTTTPQPAATGARPAYRLEASLDPAARRLSVQQTVRILNDTPDAWDELVFHVSAAYWPGTFGLRAVRVGENLATREVLPTWDVTLLRVPLAAPLPPGAHVTVAMEYALNLPQVDPQLWSPEGNAGWSRDLFQLGDWYPQLVPYADGQWQTWEFRPVGDPVINRLADFDVTVDVPPDYVVAAPGRVGDAPAQRFRLEKARSFAFFTSPEYVLFEEQVDGVPIRLYVTRDHERLGPLVLDTAVRALPFLTQYFGPYPYEELVIAENGYLASMEYSAFVSLSADAFDIYDGTPAALLVAITVHEIAHQWWYGAIGNDQVREPWLDESMAMLSELLYYETFHPEWVSRWWDDRVHFANATGPVDATIYDFFDSQAFIFETYSRAAAFMADLRALMGPDAFYAFLYDFSTTYRDRFITRDDFFTAVRAHSDADLTPLLDEYFSRS